jgi:hypothetical protein
LSEEQMQELGWIEDNNFEEELWKLHLSIQVWHVCYYCPVFFAKFIINIQIIIG